MQLAESPSPSSARDTNPDLALDAEGELLVKPDVNGGALLQQAEDVVDRSQQCLAACHGGGGDVQQIR